MFFHQNGGGRAEQALARTAGIISVARAQTESRRRRRTCRRQHRHRRSGHQRPRRRPSENHRACRGSDPRHRRVAPVRCPRRSVAPLRRRPLGRAGGGTKALADGFARAAEAAGANVEISFVETMNPEALAERLRACASAAARVSPSRCSIMRWCARRSPSGARRNPGRHRADRHRGRRPARLSRPRQSRRGRTAGLLMGRFCGGAGKLAVVWGGQLYRSHEERESGFRSVLRTERPDLQSLELITGNDNPEMTRARVREAIATPSRSRRHLLRRRRRGGCGRRHRAGRACAAGRADRAQLQSRDQALPALRDDPCPGSSGHGAHRR